MVQRREGMTGLRASAIRSLSSWTTETECKQLRPTGKSTEVSLEPRMNELEGLDSA